MFLFAFDWYLCGLGYCFKPNSCSCGGCPAGQYQGSTCQSGCDNCPAGQYRGSFVDQYQTASVTGEDDNKDDTTIQGGFSNSVGIVMAGDEARDNEADRDDREHGQSDSLFSWLVAGGLCLPRVSAASGVACLLLTTLPASAMARSRRKLLSHLRCAYGQHGNAYSGCHSCPPGQYNNYIQYQNTCVYCPGGQYQGSYGQRGCSCCGSGMLAPPSLEILQLACMLRC